MLQDHEKRISKIESSLKTSQGKRHRIAGGRKSITDLFEELKNEKFFNQPKNIQQIADKLAENGYHYAKDSLTAPLQRAVRNRILGRIQKAGKWAWVSR